MKDVEFGRVEATRAAREAEPAGARPEARQGARRRARCARGRRVRGARRAAASASAGHELGPTRCSSSGRAAKAGRSPRRRASRSRSTRRSTPSSSSRAASRPDPHAQLDAQGAGLELTDRIEVTLPAEHADLLAHADWIKAEALAGLDRHRRRRRAGQIAAGRCALRTRPPTAQSRAARSWRLPTRSSSIGTGPNGRGVSLPEIRPLQRLALDTSRRHVVTAAWHADVGRRRTGGWLALRLGERELAAELDREAEGDVLVDHPERLDPLDAPRAEPVADPRDELLRRGRARGDADRRRRPRATPRRSPSRRRSGAPRRRRRAPPRRAGSSSTSCASRSRAAGRSRSSISFTAHCRLEVA